MPPLNKLVEHKHICKYCGRLFNFKWGLIEHVRRIHENYRPHKCDVCQKSFVKKCDLKTHVESHNERIYKCKYCESAFKTRQGRLWHEDTHGVNQYECPTCKEIFDRRYKLNLHIKVHKKVSDDSHHECPYCWFTFSTLEFKNEHVSKAHSKCKINKFFKAHNTTRNKEGQIEQRKDENFPMPSYSCVACGQTLKNLHYLNKHIKTDHPGEKIFYQICKKCGRKVSCGYFRTHMMSHYNIKPFACDVCDSRFPRKNELNIHMASHITVKLFNCLKCPSKFKLQMTLQKHIKELHSSEIHTCNICNRLFKSTASLNHHIKRVHDRAANCTKCTVCNNEVFYKDLSRHMKQFHDELKMLCEICGKTCENAWYLNHHLKKCKNVGVRPHASCSVRNCPHCPFSYQNASTLRKHCLKNHADIIIKCQSCDKICLCKVSYDKHQKKQHKDIPQHCNDTENFVCHFCGFIPVKADNLAEHLKTHESHEYFECYFCGFIATGSNNLAEHLKAHEYYKWLLSCNKNVICCDKSVFIYTDYSQYQPLLIKVKKEISWIHDISGETKRMSKIIQAEHNIVKTDETKVYNEPRQEIYQPRSYLVANSSLRSKGNIVSSIQKFGTKQVDILPEVIEVNPEVNSNVKLEVIDIKPEVVDVEPEVFDIDDDKISLKFEMDECQDGILEKNHNLNSVNSANVNSVDKFNLTNNVPLEPFIYLKDLKKLDECSLKDLLKSF